jgi:hypothetical protein
MVITFILGGLGNQMFQYAIGKAISLRTNQKLALDLTFFSDKEHRNFELDCFNVSYRLSNTSNTKKFHRLIKLKKISKKIGVFNKYFENRVFEERFFHFDSTVLNIKNSVLIKGYWQSEKYFLEFRHVILNDFTLKFPPSTNCQKVLSLLNDVLSVSLHVRRGDYITNPEAYAFHGICSLDYYKDAVNLILSSFPSSKFFIFSDDLDWCKENFTFIKNVYFVDLGIDSTDYEEMYLMSNCNHNIIANSSFSWWGAWLNRNSEKVVIAPKKWFSDHSINTSDLVPSTWIRL